MSYQVLILRRAQKELSELPRADFIRIQDAIQALSVEPRPVINGIIVSSQ